MNKPILPPYVYSGENTKVKAITFTDSISGDSGGDFTLPDYLPAIRKIVATSAKIEPDGKFISGSDSGEGGFIVNFGGEVSYYITYISDEGELCGANLKGEYDGSTAVGRQNGMVTVDTKVESSNCRVTAPRKLTMKTRLKSKVTVIGERDIAANVVNCATMADELSLEKLKIGATAVKLRHSESRDHRADGEISVPDAKRLLMCGAKVVVKAVEPEATYAAVSGDIEIKCTYADSEGVKTETAIVPLDEEVELPNTSAAAEKPSKANVSAFATVTSFDAAENDGTLEYSLTYELDVTEAMSEKISMTGDIYSTAYPCDVKYRDVEVIAPLICQSGQLTVSETVKRSDADEVSIIDVSTEAVPERAEIQNGKMNLSGTVKFTVTVDSDSGVAVEDYSVPFKYVAAAADAGGGDIFWRANITCTGAECSVSGENITLRTENAVAITAVTREKYHTVDTAELDKTSPITGENNVIRIYYPESGETGWSVAKKFAVPVDSIDFKPENPVIIS